MEKWKIKEFMKLCDGKTKLTTSDWGKDCWVIPSYMQDMRNFSTNQFTGINQCNDIEIYYIDSTWLKYDVNKRDRKINDLESKLKNLENEIFKLKREEK